MLEGVLCVAEHHHSMIMHSSVHNIACPLEHVKGGAHATT
jgi:hypothetical protein